MRLLDTNHAGLHGLVRRFLTNERQRQVSFRCWLWGHQDFVRFMPGRLYLECLECGRETNGWRIGKTSGGRDTAVGERTCGGAHCVPCVLSQKNAVG